MTEQPTTETVVPTVETPPSVPEGPAAPPAGKREARYRTELRAAAAERDALTLRVQTMQRAEAERLSGLAKPAAIWAAGVELADVLTDDEVDPAKVELAAARATEELGAVPAPRAPRPDMSQGGNGVPARTDSWTDAFGPDR